jgi:hypothetical protein
MAIRGKESLTSEEISYIAGFFDGEGNVNIYKTDTKNNTEVQQRLCPKYELSVSMYNTDMGIIEWLYEVFGGYFQIKNKGGKPPYRKESYVVRLGCNKASAFLEMLYPYLKIKKEQAKIAIEFQKVKIDKTSRFAKITPKQLDFFENSYLQLRQLINSSTWQFNNSVAAKRFHPQRLNETTLEIVKR